MAFGDDPWGYCPVTYIFKKLTRDISKLQFSNLTILKESPQKLNIFGIIADTPEGYCPAPYILQISFHTKHLPRREYASVLNCSEVI